MGTENQPLKGVPTNIITGFLGVGKTTAILNLLANKPKNESWAVLVNEFGEIGVDGSLLNGQQQDSNIHYREVPGGCMCCAAGLPMQIALNQLLAEARPDRLLIEPTGLGHPKEVLQVLSNEYYRQTLSLQKNITLVDARNLSDTRYTTHETFNQQIAIADTVVGNKLDLYNEGDKERLAAYVEKIAGSSTRTLFSKHGEIPFKEFEGESKRNVHLAHHHHHHHNSKQMAADMALPESGFLKATNQGEGFESVGWRFAPDKVFNRQSILQLLAKVDAERLKAVFITESGIFGYNQTQDGLTEVELDECIESRIELISHQADQTMEAQLLNCLNMDR
jgi:G3E family GTPase